MTDPLVSLDAFLEYPEGQRDVVRVVRALLFASRQIALVYGDAGAAAELVTRLARTLPDPNLDGWLVTDPPGVLRLAPDLEPEPRPATDATTFELIRALLRQDPDLIGVARVDDVAAPLLVTAALTGHAILAGTGLASVEAFALAASAEQPSLEAHARSAIDLAIEVEREAGGKARIRAVWWRTTQGVLSLVARVEGRSCHVDRAALPLDEPAPPMRVAPLAPPLAMRAAGTVAPRPAFVPITRPGEEGRSRIAARRVLRDRGASWPACKACEQPLDHVVQLDLANLPEPLACEPGIVQLFVCTEGCDTASESAPGVLLELVGDDAVEVDAPVPARASVVAPGTIDGWHRIHESPGPDDREALGLPPPSHEEGDGEDGSGELPLRCDKVGGYPAWEQGRDVPVDAGGAPMELLFQLVEGDRREGGTPGRWSFEDARFVAGTAARSVLDPELPRHFVSLLTGGAVAFLFRSPGRGRLAFRWQTG